MECRWHAGIRGVVRPERRPFPADRCNDGATGDFAATLLQSGRVLVTGGEDDRALASADVFDAKAGTFISTGKMLAGRTMHTATLLSNGDVLIVGGGDYQHPLAAAELYETRAGRFVATGTMGTARYKHGAIRLPRGNVLVLGGSDARDWRGLIVGGYDRTSAATSSAWLYHQ